jgi:hypothetical protein
MNRNHFLIFQGTKNVNAGLKFNTRTAALSNGKKGRKKD